MSNSGVFDFQIAIDFMNAKQLAEFLQMTSDKQRDTLRRIEQIFEKNTHNYERAVNGVYF